MRSPIGVSRRSAASYAIVAVTVLVVLVVCTFYAWAENATDKKLKGVYQCAIFSGVIHPGKADDEHRQKLQDDINAWYENHPDIQYVTPIQTQSGDDPSVQAVTYTITYQQK